MNIVVLDVIHIGRVSMMCESSEPCPVQVSCQWCVASNKAIDSHIKFLPSNEQWINDVPLNNVGLCLGAFWLPSEVIFPLGDLL